MTLTEKTTVEIRLILLVGILVSLASGALIMGGWTTSIEDRLTVIESNDTEQRQDIKAIQRRQDSQDLDLVEIKTDLKWVRAYLEGSNERD